MRGIRSVAVAAVVIAMVGTGGGAIAVSGVPSPWGFTRPSGPAPFADSLEEDDARSSGRERLQLFGKQLLDEATIITPDGRIFGAGDEFPIQAPGTASLVAELSGANEVSDDGTPGAGDPDGTGTAQVTLTFDPPEVCATLAVEGIALPATAAHIHEGAAGVNGPIVVPLPTPGADGTAEGCVTEGVTTELLEAIADNPAGYYVNVHNEDYPAGAVRGQLAQDPNAVAATPGIELVYRERLFALDDSDPANPKPQGEQIGTVLGECIVVTFLEAPEDVTFNCSRVFTLTKRGDISVKESYSFADPAADTLAVTGGTGRFRDVGGQVNYRPVAHDGSDIVDSVYDVRLLHLR